LKTTVVETGVAGTGVTETDAAVEEEVETEEAAVIVLVVAAVAEVCYNFDLQMIISILPAYHILSKSSLLFIISIFRSSFIQT